jgi:t-SNARE complex subunit (syntaxin)
MAPSGDANRKKDTLDMKSDESRTTANMEDQSVTDIDTKLIRYRGALVEAVYQYIRTNPGATADEIAEAINESSGEITSTLVKLLEQKRIRVNS